MSIRRIVIDRGHARGRRVRRRGDGRLHAPRGERACGSATVDGGTIAFLKGRTSVESFAARDITGRPISLSGLPRQGRHRELLGDVVPALPRGNSRPHRPAGRNTRISFRSSASRRTRRRPEEVATLRDGARMNYPIVMTTPEIEQMFPNDPARSRRPSSSIPRVASRSGTSACSTRRSPRRKRARSPDCP